MRRLRRDFTRKRALLVVGNDMNARYVDAIKNLFEGDARVAFFATEGLGDNAAARAYAAEIDIPYVSRLRAMFRWWDLIVFAAHHAPGHFHPDIPKLFIHHSYDSGKKSNGEDHRYGSNFVLDAEGRPRYTVMLDMSEHTRERVERELPALRGSIRVVGDLMADQLLGSQSQREEIRHELGFAPDERVVLIMSTWGADSLMESMGHEILATAGALGPPYRFILSTHPNHWSGPHAKSQPWGERLLAAKERGFSVIEPGDDWSRFAIATDVAITDHTSLAVTFALLGKPMYFVPVNPSEIAEGTIGRALYEALPRLEAPSQLESTLRRASEDYPLNTLREIRARINSYPEEAEARTRRVISEFFGFE